MNPRYLQTFARHRILLLSPIVLAVLVAAWFVVGTPKSYEATTSLWFDNSHPSDLTVQTTDAAQLPPAADGQALLSEMLTTRTFRLRVGHKGPLAKYLATHPSSGWSPSALIAQLKATPSLDKRITDALGKAYVASTVAGPQVLAVSFKAGDAKVAAATLTALIAEFRAERSGVSVARAKASVAYYRAQVAAATKAADTSRAELAQYRLENPASDVLTDSSLRELSRIERAAVSRLLAVTNDLNQAKLNRAVPIATNSSLRVIDAPRVPDGPVSGRKMVVLAVVAGLFAGALVSILGVLGLTTLERRSEEQRDDDLNGAAPMPAAKAFRGTVVGVRDEGTPRTTRPVWTIHEPAGEQAPLGLGSPVLQAKAPSRRGIVGDVTETADGGRVIELEITRTKLGVRGGVGILAVRPTDTRWIGVEVAFAHAPETRAAELETNGSSPDADNANGSGIASHEAGGTQAARQDARSLAEHGHGD